MRITSTLCWIAVASIILGIIIIIVNFRNEHSLRKSVARLTILNPNYETPVLSTVQDIRTTLKKRTTKYALIIIAIAVIGFGVAVWKYQEAYYIAANWYFFGCFSIPWQSQWQWIIVLFIAMLGAAWIIVAKSIHSEKTRQKLITEDNILDNETRRRIIALVKESPGIHFSRIKTLLNLSPRTIRDQLDVLVSFGQIKAISINGKKAYFVPDSEILSSSKRMTSLSLLAFLQRSGTETLLRALFSSPGTSFTSIMDLLQEPRSTIRRKIRTLEHRHYVNVTRIGREMIAIHLVPTVEKILNQMTKKDIDYADANLKE